MKVKTSIVLSEDILESIDRLAASTLSRSAFIERVLREYLHERTKSALQARDLESINNAADRLNLESAQVLGYQ